MKWWKLAGWMLAATVLGSVVTGVPGVAQNKPKTDLSVGFVDLGLITDQIKQLPAWKVEVSKFDDAKSRFRDEIETLTKRRYLNKAERDELDNLRAKTKPSDSEKDRIGKLEKKSEDMDQEYQGLGQIEKLSAEQLARLTELKTVREKGLADLQMETEKRAGLLSEMEGAVLDAMQKRVLQAVEKVSQNKGLTIVFDRQTVLFGGVDLTKDVLKQLQ